MWHSRLASLTPAWPHRDGFRTIPHAEAHGHASSAKSPLGRMKTKQDEPQAEVGPAATPLAPASDLQTRQLRLLPWQSSASSSSGGNSGGSGSSSSSREQQGGMDSCQSSTHSARSEASNTRVQAGALGQAPAIEQSQESSSWLFQQKRIAHPNKFSTSLKNRFGNNVRSSSESSSIADTPAARPPRLLGPCPECNGRRVVSTARGPQPCMTCQQWRRRPEFRPGAELLTLQDVNFAALDGISGSDADDGLDGSDSNMKRVKRKSGPMSAERRQAISRALQNKGAKSAEHRRSISRAMREAHARNPQLRRSGAGLKKRCGYCGQEGHNRKTCPELAADVAAKASEMRESAKSPRGVIFIEEVDNSAAPQTVEQPNSQPMLTANQGSTANQQQLGQSSLSVDAVVANAPASREGFSSQAASISQRLTAPPGVSRTQPLAADSQLALPAQAMYPDLLPTRQLAPGMALSPEGAWIFPLPRTKEDCVAQAAQAVLRAWDDGVRRQALELLLPQADPSADGGWPGGIRQQFRVAKPMVELLLRRLKQHDGLSGRITAELLDEGDCVGAWQSERLAAVLFPTADTMPDLRRIDDALSGKRLTLMINPQWQIQGQVISDFGFGRARKAAERFVAAFDEVYYLRRVRVFGDDVRIMRCYPGQWQVHYVPPDAPADTALLSCDDSKPTFQRLIELLKAVRGSRASKTWLDRVLTSSMGTFNEFAAYPPEDITLDHDNSSVVLANASTDVTNAHPTTGGNEATAPNTANAGNQQLMRDIVTGEVLQAADSKTAVNDIRLEPVKQIARWLP